MKHLSLNLLDSPAGMTAVAAMQKLGITFQLAVPQSVHDCWHFWCCESVPATLPDYLHEIDTAPEQFLGHGLSPADVAMIAQYTRTGEIAPNILLFAGPRCYPTGGAGDIIGRCANLDAAKVQLEHHVRTATGADLPVSWAHAYDVATGNAHDLTADATALMQKYHPNYEG